MQLKLGVICHPGNEGMQLSDEAAANLSAPARMLLPAFREASRIGRLSSGGTVSDVGLLIGTEMFRNSEGLRSIVAHELIHFQQRKSGRQRRRRLPSSQ